MTFREETATAFLDIFDQSSSRIRESQGCHQLELLRCTDNDVVFFTLSIWESEDHLNNYRHSELFKDTWAKTKQLFGDKPMAWSTEVARNVNT